MRKLTLSYMASNALMEETDKVSPSCVEGDSHRWGINGGEPLTVAMDALYKYAEAYKTRFGGPLADDHFLGDEWLQSISALRALLNGDGALAMIAGRSTDSKSNGALEALFWRAITAAGFTESDVQ